MHGRTKNNIKDFLHFNSLMIIVVALLFILNIPINASEMISYYYVFLSISLILFFGFLLLLIYLRIKFPPRAFNYYLLPTLLNFLLMFLFYWFVNTAFPRSYSSNVKLIYVSFLTFFLILLVLFFRYNFYPRRFIRNGYFDKAVKNKAIDPENAILKIDEQLTRMICSKKKPKGKSYPWVYPLGGVLGVIAARFFKLDENTMFKATSLLFSCISLLWGWFFSFQLHDLTIIRKWEKENNRLLKIK
jgi:hypothetical protein